MSNPCVYCSKLTIESLVALARQKAKRGRAYYKHHNSFGDLEVAALAGCDMCRLALECFQRWSLYEKARNLKRSDVKVWIELQHGNADSLKPPEVLDTIGFCVGETSVEDPDGFAELRVRLIAKEGISAVHNRQSCLEANRESPSRLYSSAKSVFGQLYCRRSNPRLSIQFCHSQSVASSL
jgi:hypothetical protein